MPLGAGEAASPQSLTKTGAAYEALRSAIESGRLQPGERLPIAALIEELGVSPTPIREALRLLEAEGLVENQPHRGMVVRSYSMESLDDIYYLRLLLEPAATELAAQRATPAQLASLHRIHAQLARSASSPSSRINAANLNASWHRAIYSASDSHYLIEFINRLWAAIPVQALWVSGHSQASIGEHSKIIKALDRRDGQAAAALMRQHIESAAKSVRQRLAVAVERDAEAQDLG